MNITNPPRGLISILGLNDMGDVPRELSPIVAPTVDILQLLLLDRESVSASSGFSTINSVGVLGPVPVGEMWYIHAFGVTTSVLAAGESIKITAGFIAANNYIAGSLPDTAVAGARAEVFIEENFFLPPGGQLACRSNQITTGGTISVTGNAVITRLRV